MAFSKRFVRRPPRVNAEWTERAITVAKSLFSGSLPPIYVADLKAGSFEFRSWDAKDLKTHTRINIPLWATDPKAYGEPFEKDYFEYYIAHELAHYLVWRSGFEESQKDVKRREVHGKEFYNYFTSLCKPSLRHYEYSYLNASATRWMGPCTK